MPFYDTPAERNCLPFSDEDSKTFPETRPTKEKSAPKGAREKARVRAEGSAACQNAGSSQGVWLLFGQAGGPRTLKAAEALAARLEQQGHEPAYAHWMAMPPLVKRTYTRAYADAKTETGRAKRFSWIMERLDHNLKPM